MRKVFNFNAGPAMLPEEVLQEAQRDMLDWQGTGMSIMEIGHRSQLFKDVAEETEANLRELMQIPENYHTLFLAGGATAQFAMIPLNLTQKTEQVDYINTGIWSKKAIEEAKKFAKVNVAATTQERNGLFYIPSQDTWQLNSNAAYLHYTPNETIQGIEFNWIPEVNVPLVADMSSMILSRPVDVSRYGLIYACAQKNLGQAGITVVIIRDDLIVDLKKSIPSLYEYKLQADNHSFYNTPPTYSWYISGLMLKWMKKQGIENLYELNKQKASMLYDCIDTHADFYVCSVDKSCRSIMNAAFTLPSDKLNALFLKEAADAGLCNLKGHRLAGGVRASIYNAMPLEGVKKLTEFMVEFKQRHQ